MFISVILIPPQMLPGVWVLFAVTDVSVVKGCDSRVAHCQLLYHLDPVVATEAASVLARERPVEGDHCPRLAQT